MSLAQHPPDISTQGVGISDHEIDRDKEDQESRNYRTIRDAVEMSFEIGRRCGGNPAERTVRDAFGWAFGVIDNSLGAFYDHQLGETMLQALYDRWNWRGMPNGIHTVQGRLFTLRNTDATANHSKPAVEVHIMKPNEGYDTTGRGGSEGIWSILELKPRSSE